MHDYKDEYIRDYSFDPELLLGRKDSIKIQKRVYQKKKLGKKPKRRKLFLTIPLTDSNQYGNSGSSSGASGLRPAGKTQEENSDNEEDIDDEDANINLPQKQIDSKIQEFYHVSQLTRDFLRNDFFFNFFDLFQNFYS